MVGIQRNIIEYKDFITTTGITPGDYKPAKIIMKRFIRVFQKVKDPRSTGMLTYPLHEILVISFLAILGNASSWYELHDFGISH